MQWIVIGLILVVTALVAINLSPSTQEEVTSVQGEMQDEMVEENVEMEERFTPSNVIKGAALDLSGQGLESVPMYVFDQRNLSRLDLSNNQLTGALQAEVRHLSNLQILDLSSNQFTGVPAEVGQLNKLEELNLSNNELTGLPHELANLKNLKTLDLRGNDPSEFDLNIIREGLSNTSILVD